MPGSTILDEATGPITRARLDEREAGRIAGIRLNRHELAGAFGDIGTDLPLLLGMILAANLPAVQTLLVYGTLQIFSGLFYRLPMPIQPLKMVAALVIAQQLPAPLIYGAGLSIGLAMLLLTLTGLLEWLARQVPKAVVRGIQLGLGAKLALLAVGHYMTAEGTGGLLLAMAGVAIVIALHGNSRWPASLFVIALGILYALFLRVGPSSIHFEPSKAFGGLAPPPMAILQGFLLLGLPQIPLSLGNSILATGQTVRDLFPQRPISIRRIGLTYSLMNLFASLLQGIPVCHGSGGLAGHYVFGARTGGSVVIYGCGYMIGALILFAGGGMIFNLFPFPILGVLLLVEALALVFLSRDLLARPASLSLAVAVAIVAVTLPYGFLAGICLGTLSHHGFSRLTRPKLERALEETLESGA